MPPAGCFCQPRKPLPSYSTAKALRTRERLRQGCGSAEGEAENDDDGEDHEAPKAAISDRLAQRLSAHRTAALQIEVARHPQVALAALVHGMVQTVLQERHYGHDLPLGVRLTVQDRLEGMAPDWPDAFWRYRLSSGRAK